MPRLFQWHDGVFGWDILTQSVGAGAQTEPYASYAERKTIRILCREKLAYEPHICRFRNIFGSAS